MGIFEKFSQSYEGKKAKVLPLVLTISLSKAFEIATKFLNDNNYYGVNPNKDFNEIYYWSNGFEVTLFLAVNGAGKCVLDLSIYGEKKRGKTRKKLVSEMEKFKELFKDYH